MDKSGYVYILTNRNNTVLYTGATSDLERRVYQHKTDRVKGFTRKYNCNKLLWFEYSGDLSFALEREMQIKGYSRKKKIWLVETDNPYWIDLAADWFE